MGLLPSPSSLCSLYNRPVNWRRGVEARNITLFGKPADREDGGLGSPKKPFYRGLDASFFSRIREGGKVKGQNREGEAERK